MSTIRVRTAAPYDVVIGKHVLDRLPGLLPGAARVGVVYAGPVAAHAQRARAVLEAAGVTVELIELPDAERAKTAEVVARCWSRFAQAGLSRRKRS